MKRTKIDGWLEHLLILLLPERDRETIVGDLLEETQAKVEEMGAFRAWLWYARQVVSFVPRWVMGALERRPVLTALCLFTALCALWLGAMDLRLRPPGYVGQVGIAATILAEALVTLASLALRLRWLRYAARAGTFGILWPAAKVLAGVVSGQNFEGYILLIALALVVQSVLTWRRMPEPGGRMRKA